MQKMFILFITIIYAIPAFAESNTPCADANTQLEMNRCVAEQYKLADNELNVTYKKLFTSLDTEHKTKLKKAEAAWIEFRDLHCEAQSHLSVGGSIHSLEILTCKTSLTKERTRQLETMMEITNR